MNLLLTLTVISIHCHFVAQAAEDPLTLSPEDLDKIIEQNKGCIDDFQKLSNLVEKRFSASQLGLMCRNRKKWTTDAENHLKKLSDSQDNLLTNTQLAWLDQLYSCDNLQSCVCRESDTCMSGVNQNRTNSTESRHKRQSVQQSLIRPALRKEYRMLTDFERQRLHKGLNQLKLDVIDKISKYDLLAIYHRPEYAPGAHWGPAFLPWHRELLKQLEVSLRSYDNLIALPYWDSTLDESLPNPRDSILWTEDFFGNGDGYVETGPFKRWSVSKPILSEPRLVRNVGRAPFGGLYRSDDLDTVLTRTKFEQLTNCVDPYFELLHGTVHMWVGGHMLDVPISPNDPVFFMHHAFVDYLWEQFRYHKQNRASREVDYPEEPNCCNQFHYTDSFMAPFKIKNSEGLSNKYTDTYYVYENRPTCSISRPDCKSPYLFCNRKKYMCMSKIVVGGNCTGFESEDICRNSACVNGICRSVDNSLTANEVKKDFATVVPNVNLPTRVPEKHILSFTILDETTTTSTTPTTPISTSTSSTTPTTPMFTSTTPSTTSTTTTVTTTNAPTTSASSAALTTTTSTTSATSTHSETATSTTLTTTTTGEATLEATSTPSVELLELTVDEFMTTHAPVTTAFSFDKSICKCTCDSDDTVRTARLSDPTAMNKRARNPAKIEKHSPVQVVWLNDAEPISDNIEYVWFTVTVLKGRLELVTKEYVNANVTAEGVNYKEEFMTTTSTKTFYPSYPGATVVKVKNPKLLKGTTNVAVTAASGDTKCKAFCFQNRAVNYIRCSGNLKLAPDQISGDPVILYTNESQALLGPWTGKSRQPDYLMFLCPEEFPSTKNKNANCQFLRLENFMLVGYSDKVQEGLTLDACKTLCREAEAKFSIKCHSLMYWTIKKTCIVTKESRFTQPALFGMYPNENVFYMDYVCSIDKVLER